MISHAPTPGGRRDRTSGRVLALDPGTPAYPELCWAVASLAAPSQPRYVEHGRLRPRSPLPDGAEAAEVLSNLIEAYRPEELIMTSCPPLREARGANPFDPLAAARRSGVSVRVVPPETLLSVLQDRRPGRGQRSADALADAPAAVLNLAATPQPPGANRALASALAVLLRPAPPVDGPC